MSYWIKHELGRQLVAGGVPTNPMRMISATCLTCGLRAHVITARRDADHVPCPNCRARREAEEEAKKAAKRLEPYARAETLSERVSREISEALAGLGRKRR